MRYNPYIEKSAINTRFKAAHEVQANPNEDQAAALKRKKKGLTEKDLDFEEMWDDDEEEDQVVLEEDDPSENEDALSEDGRKMKVLLGDRVNEDDTVKPMNLNFEVESQAAQGFNVTQSKEEDENEAGEAEESDSSMASIFGDDEVNPDGDDGDENSEVGQKRTAGEAKISTDKDGYERKRFKS